MYLDYMFYVFCAIKCCCLLFVVVVVVVIVDSIPLQTCNCYFVYINTGSSYSMFCDSVTCRRPADALLSYHLRAKGIHVVVQSLSIVLQQGNAVSFQNIREYIRRCSRCMHLKNSCLRLFVLVRRNNNNNNKLIKNNNNSIENILPCDKM